MPDDFREHLLSYIQVTDAQATFSKDMKDLLQGFEEAIRSVSHKKKRYSMLHHFLPKFRDLTNGADVFSAILDILYARDLISRKHMIDIAMPQEQGRTIRELLHSDE